MTEPQDVLADLLRRLDGWAGDAATRYERADEMVDVARRELRAALVRTPETLDDSTLLERLATALYDVRWWEKASYDGLSTGELARDLYNLLAATQSPTPPEGLRAAVALIAADWFDTGYENGRLDHGVLADRLFAALAASPAPDPEGLHDEFAWLIERGQPEKQVPTVWWADRKRWGLAHMDEWTEDANKAYRFASKAEAEDYIERHSPIPSHRPRLGRAVEHGFLASPAPDPGADQ